MPTYSRPTVTFNVAGKTMIKESWSGSYTNSPKVGGVLKLQGNSCDLVHHVLLGYSETPSPSGYYSSERGATTGASPPQSMFIQSDNQAYARWRGKLHKGGASLGVTLASYRQSREMVVSRLNKVGNALDHAATALQSNPGRRAKLRLKHRRRELLADDVLEAKFGWGPLMEDIHAATTTVMGKDSIPPQWVKGRGRAVDYGSYRDVSIAVKTNEYRVYQTMTTYGSRVDVTNPNTWLLNRAGLLNPAVVAWDLVPWSFVVNMFVNVNSVLSCVTDDFGLSVSENTITRTSHTFVSTIAYGYAGYQKGMVYSSQQMRTRKTRTPGVALRPVLEFKVPELNWGLAVTAASLVVQKFKKLNAIIGI